MFVIWLTTVDEIADSEISTCMRGLSSTERNRILVYKFKDDQKRCLLSHLLQNNLVRQLCGLRPGKYTIQRSAANKPYLETKSMFNFNVSHHGRYVGIVAHSHVKVSEHIGLGLIPFTSD
jgi:phosphopantetheinyl transferase